MQSGCGRRTNGGKFGPHVNDHNHRHDEGEDVHEVVGGLEDERVGQHKRARVALGLDAAVTADVLVADQGAQWYRHLLAYRGEVAEAHGVGGCGDAAVVQRWAGRAVGSGRKTGGGSMRRRVGRALGQARRVVGGVAEKASEESARG